MNPSINTEKGQSVTLTCVIHAKDVGSKSIAWYKDGDRINDNHILSINRFISLLGFYSSIESDHN